jgi:hypothetical protein
VRKKHAKNAVFFESDGEKGLKALKGEKVLFPGAYLIPALRTHTTRL